MLNPEIPIKTTHSENLINFDPIEPPKSTSTHRRRYFSFSKCTHDKKKSHDNNKKGKANPNISLSNANLKDNIGESYLRSNKSKLLSSPKDNILPQTSSIIMDQFSDDSDNSAEDDHKIFNWNYDDSSESSLNINLIDKDTDKDMDKDQDQFVRRSRSQNRNYRSHNRRSRSLSRGRGRDRDDNRNRNYDDEFNSRSQSQGYNDDNDENITRSKSRASSSISRGRSLGRHDDKGRRSYSYQYQYQGSNSTEQQNESIYSEVTNPNKMTDTSAIINSYKTTYIYRHHKSLPKDPHESSSGYNDSQERSDKLSRNSIEIENYSYSHYEDINSVIDRYKK